MRSSDCSLLPSWLVHSWKNDRTKNTALAICWRIYVVPLSVRRPGQFQGPWHLPRPRARRSSEAAAGASHSKITKPYHPRPRGVYTGVPGAGAGRLGALRPCLLSRLGGSQQRAWAAWRQRAAGCWGLERCRAGRVRGRSWPGRLESVNCEFCKLIRLIGFPFQYTIECNFVNVCETTTVRLRPWSLLE